MSYERHGDDVVVVPPQICNLNKAKLPQKCTDLKIGRLGMLSDPAGILACTAIQDSELIFVNFSLLPLH